MQSNVIQEEMMQSNAIQEEMIQDNELPWFDWIFRIAICYKRSCSSPELKPQLYSS